MLVLQRGASNVYFPVIKSAISIPPYIDKLYIMIEDGINYQNENPIIQELIDRYIKSGKILNDD